MQYQPIIGLEVHVELATKSKMFCGCPAEHFGVEPNTHTCPVCLGLPGALPVPNRKAVDWTIMLGLALGCKINENSKFDRKNYFYPDLAKGYQISQYDEPLCESGALTIGSGKNSKQITIRRVHLEEDTGKLQHAQVNGEQVSLVDFNRGGVPLVEIVTEPDFRSIEEVDEYLKKLQKIVRYLGISGADMEKGSMRLEPSISISTDGKLPAYRVELKNINSFRFARHALEFEIQRQINILEKGDKPTQQTRGWNEAKGETMLQRDKEEANDYRYFPEPDIPPMRFSREQIINIKNQIPELPDAKSARFQTDFDLTDYTANLLADDPEIAKYFEESVQVVKELKETSDLIKDVANWIVNKRVDVADTVPGQLVKFILKSKQVNQVDENEMDEFIQKLLEENQQLVSDIKNGKTAAIGVLIGKAIKHYPNNKDLVISKLNTKLN